jgi:hypothetical protein
MASRKTIEKEIVKTISSKISQFGFKLSDKEINLFDSIQNNIKWELHFHLYNNSVYSLFCKAAVRYIELTQIIHDLLINTEFEGRLNCGVGIVEDELKIVKEKQSLKISNIEEVNDFSELFFERIIKIKEMFWIPQSDPNAQMESFKKTFHHWINGDFIQNVALWISTGIRDNDINKIKFGIERGYQLGRDQEMIDLLYLRITEKGYNI